MSASLVEESHKERLDTILRHIENVRDDCLLLGERLMSQGEEDVGRLLIANGLIHDNSKLHGIEWLYLNPETEEKDPLKFQLALTQHITNNLHHPEAWPGGIDEMSRVYRAEMVADWHSRSSEFGTDLRDWVKQKATKKYKMNHQGKTYKELKELLDLLLEKKFV